mmetsp:Transcript_37843/g.87886  ORF Transcript_37843/g.87886 Transcript_37843/m.87886 type:complete len:254 (-) Transcript_37843:16-777(-)
MRRLRDCVRVGHLLAQLRIIEEIVCTLPATSSFSTCIVLLILTVSCCKGEHALVVYGCAAMLFLNRPVRNWGHWSDAGLKVTEGVPREFSPHNPRRVQRAIVLVHLHFRDAHKIVNCLANHPAKESVLAVQRWGTAQSDEELTAVGPRPLAGARNTKHSTVPELQSGVDLVNVRFTINGLTAVTGASPIPTLNDVVFDDAMKDGAIVVAFEDQRAEVAARLRALGRPQFDLQVPVRRAQEHLAFGARLLHIHL